MSVYGQNTEQKPWKNVVLSKNNVTYKQKKL